MSRPSGPIRQIKEALEYAGVRLLGAAIGALPVDFASAAMGRTWRLIAPLTSRHRRALTHLALAMPEKTPAEREAIARAMWENLGRVFAETFFIEKIANDPARVSFAQGERVREIAASGQGCSMASMHYGNWEIVIGPATGNGLRSGGIYRPLRTELVERYLLDRRLGLYPGGLFAKGDAVGRKVLAFVKDGGHIAMLADQRKMRGVEVPFFGRPAPTNPFPAMIARVLDVPLIAARTIRTGGARFRIEIEEVPVPRTADRSADILAATTALHAIFERWIREYPDHWMWAQKRWGAIAPGEVVDESDDD
ncbi:MAG: lauroyl acyltransferase [Hyphomicrobiales bacterium]